MSGTFIKAAKKEIATQIQMATGVPSLSDIIPRTKGLMAAPKFITVMFTPWQNPRCDAGEVASNIGPVDSF